MKSPFGHETSFLSVMKNFHRHESHSGHQNFTVMNHILVMKYFTVMNHILVMNFVMLVIKNMTLVMKLCMCNMHCMILVMKYCITVM